MERIRRRDSSEAGMKPWMRLSSSSVTYTPLSVILKRMKGGRMRPTSLPSPSRRHPPSGIRSRKSGDCSLQRYLQPVRRNSLSHHSATFFRHSGCCRTGNWRASFFAQNGAIFVAEKKWVILSESEPCKILLLRTEIITQFWVFPERLGRFFLLMCIGKCGRNKAAVPRAIKTVPPGQAVPGAAGLCK